MIELPYFRRKALGLLERLAPKVPIPDKLYLRIKYYFRMGKVLHLKHPKTFNEKIQWLKLYGRRPIDTVLADKYAVKEYITNTIGSQYVIPLIGVWNSFDEIDFSQLPDQFVLKCTHDSGGIVVCKDKSTLNIDKAKRVINHALKNDFYVFSREKAYKNIPRRIIAEEYKEDSKTKELRDYKFFCFDGEPKLLYVASDRQNAEEETKFDFFDMQYNRLPFTNGHPNSIVLPEQPTKFEEMKKLAGILSKGIPHVRVDFYEVNGRVFFGEMTYSHLAGMTPFDPEDWDYTLGSWITLPTITKK